VKRGCFIEFRNAMINISPIGRNCSYEERLAFEAFDKAHSIRTNMVQALEREFPDYGLKYSIGGQISIDAFPVGWDKTFCLRHLKAYNFRQIHFFGDKTSLGGNDYEIFSHPSVIGHTVKNPTDTFQQINQMFF
jgi:phosphomannomutase